MAKRLQRVGQSSGPTATTVVAERPVRDNGGVGPRGWACACASLSASQGVATGDSGPQRGASGRPGQHGDARMACERERERVGGRRGSAKGRAR